MHSTTDHPITHRQRALLALVLIAVGALLLALGACGWSSCATVPGAHPPPSVVQLRSEGGTCTAWRADWDVAITAGHCCRDASWHYAEVDGPGMVPGTEVTAVVVDLDLDVCALRANMLGQPIALAPQDPEVGDPVWTAGWPVSLFAISSGYWGGRAEAGRSGIATINVGPGESGAPLLDSGGRVVGVVVAMPVITLDRELEIVAPVTSMARIAPLEAVRSVLTRARAKLGH